MIPLTAHDYYFCMCTMAAITLALLIVGGVWTEIMFHKERNYMSIYDLLRRVEDALFELHHGTLSEIADRSLVKGQGYRANDVNRCLQVLVIFEHASVSKDGIYTIREN